MKRVLPIVALALAACGGSQSTPPVFEYGTRAVWAQRADRDEQVELAIGTALRFWGGDPGSVEGWRFLFTDGRFACGATDAAYGCTAEAERLVRLDALGTRCPGESALLHEIGHVVIGDPDHTDPRWSAREVLTSQPCTS